MNRAMEFALLMILTWSLMLGNSVCLAGDPSEELIRACYFGSLEEVKQLLAKGADVNTASQTGVTPLLAASKSGPPTQPDREGDRFEIVKLLLAKGADVNRAGNDGVTPLLGASYKGYSQIVDLLEKHGARRISQEQ